MRLLLAWLAGLLITMFAATASAYGGGAGGYTGKQGTSCNSCHSGGATPTVTITGPDTLAAGATADFTIVVTTNQTRATGGVAASTGATLTAGAGLHLEEDELTHDAAVPTAGGKASFQFKVTAPASGTTMTLFAVGLAANGSGTGGDKAAQITKDITITGGAAPTEPEIPAPPATPGTDPDPANQATPGSATTTSDATEPSGSSKKKKKKPSNDEDDEDYEGPATRRNAFESGDAAASCTMHAGNVNGTSASAALGVVLGLALLGRRRRR